MENLEFEFVSGRKCNSILLYVLSEKQLYKIKSKTNKKTYYICYEKQCSAKINLLANGVCCKPKNVKNYHNHTDQESKYKEINCINEIKQDCLSGREVLGGFNSLNVIRRAFTRACEK